MSAGVEKAKAAMAAEEAKLKKLLKAVKKFFAKEFLWVLFVLTLSVPLALIIEYIYQEYATENIKTTVVEILDKNPPLLGAYVLSIAGIYFTRTTVGAIKTLTKKEDK